MIYMSLAYRKVKRVAEVKFVGTQIHVKFRSTKEAKNAIRTLNGKTYEGIYSWIVSR